MHRRLGGFGAALQRWLEQRGARRLFNGSIAVLMAGTALWMLMLYRVSR